jgi:hypothetical protein
VSLPWFQFSLDCRKIPRSSAGDDCNEQMDNLMAESQAGIAFGIDSSLSPISAVSSGGKLGWRACRQSPPRPTAAPAVLENGAAEGSAASDGREGSR